MAKKKKMWEKLTPPQFETLQGLANIAAKHHGGDLNAWMRESDEYLTGFHRTVATLERLGLVTTTMKYGFSIARPTEEGLLTLRQCEVERAVFEENLDVE